MKERSPGGVDRGGAGREAAGSVDIPCISRINPRMKHGRAIQDVMIRWWSTFAMILLLMYLEVTIKLHEQLDGIAALLSATDWAILWLLKPVMEPFMRLEKLL